MNTIVLNEHDWAKEQIDNKTLGSKPYETLCRVARYYFDDGMSKRSVRKQLDNFLLMCEPTASLPKWSETLDYAVNRAIKYSAIDIDHIDISKTEMDKIDSLVSRQVRRLAFTLLCLAKYWDIVNTHGDHWVNSKDSDIMRMANINTSIKRQSLMYHTLCELGLIRFSKKVDNTNVRVNFIDDGEPVMQVSDFRNLGYQYLKYHGEPFYVCQNCGITVKAKKQGAGRKPKYCASCAMEIHVQQAINSVMQKRSPKKNAELANKRYTVYMHKFPDNKIYVGMTCQPLNKRWRNGAGYGNSPVYAAIKKFGWENIRHYILFSGLDRESAKFVESYYIKTRHSYLPEYGYNIHNSSYAKISDDTIPSFIMVEVDGDGNKLQN